MVLAIAVVGLATALGSASSQSHAMDADATSLCLARQLMEEVLARPFDPPSAGDHAGFKSGNHDRDTFDDIADYDGYSDLADAPSDNGGATSGGADGSRQSFRRFITVTRRATPGGPDISAAAPDADFAMISVTVTSDTPGSTAVELDRLVCRVPLVR